MGWDAGRKLRLALRHLSSVLAVELVAAARGLELRAPLRPAPATSAAVATLRQVVPGPGADRFVSPELMAAGELVRSGRLAEAVEGTTGGRSNEPGVSQPRAGHAGEPWGLGVKWLLFRQEDESARDTT